jgi:predicted ATP-grasp superfamily ATP-dependent carboligase
MSKPTLPPAVILCAQIAALALTRRLGRAGARVWLVDASGGRAAAALRSRYAWGRTVVAAGAAESADETAWLKALEEPARAPGWGRPALLATSDETLLLMSRQRERLSVNYRMLLPDPVLLEALLDKRRLHALAHRHGVAVPRSLEVRQASDLDAAARELGYPCLLKSAYSKLGGGAAATPGKARVDNREQLWAAYRRLSALDGRLLLQEYVPGGAERVALYNAYFNTQSEPVAVFTGRKLRQYPVEFGTASRSEACAMAGLAEPLTGFLRAVRYAGPIDIGLKWDERTAGYKLLDVNPRLGQNYRTYVGRDRERSDVGWLAYRELAEGCLEAPAAPITARRRVWQVASHEWRSCRELRRQGQLSAAAWAGSVLSFQLRRHEGAYWSWRDPWPALARTGRHLRRGAAAAVGGKLGSAKEAA